MRRVSGRAVACGVEGGFEGGQGGGSGAGADAVVGGDGDFTRESIRGLGIESLCGDGDDFFG